MWRYQQSLWGKPSASRGITEQNVMRGVLIQLFGACTTPDGRGLTSSFPEHWDGETSLGALGEVADEGGIRPDGRNKVLSIGSRGSASFWGRNIGIDGNDAVKNGGGWRGCRHVSLGLTRGKMRGQRGCYRQQRKNLLGNTLRGGRPRQQSGSL